MGGITGHMKHPYEYDELTGRDIKNLICDIFNNRVKLTEKIDGLNIQVYVNENGKTVFIRNNKDLNSPDGGMTEFGICEKWKNNPYVKQCYLFAAEQVAKTIRDLQIENFFNPGNGVRYTINMECVYGKTNVIPYASNRIYMHNVFVYNKTVDGWKHTDTIPLPIELERYSAPIITFKPLELTVFMDYVNRVDDILQEEMTIREYKYQWFVNWLKLNNDWILNNVDGVKYLFERWFDGQKTVNINTIKNMYPENIDRLKFLDGGFKYIVNKCMEPLDRLFIDFGQYVLLHCTGYINEGYESNSLIEELMTTVDDLMTDEETSMKVNQQMCRMSGPILPIEGVVFTWNNRLMKLTGNFAPFNQIMGIRRFDNKWKNTQEKQQQGFLKRFLNTVKRFLGTLHSTRRS